MWWISRDGLESGWRVVDRIGVDAAALTSVAFLLRFFLCGRRWPLCFLPSFPMCGIVCACVTHPDFVFTFEPTPLCIPLLYPALGSGGLRFGG